jgi:phage major head subunit gpT-like protein
MLINKANLNFLFQQWDTRFQSVYESTPTFFELYSTTMPSTTERSVHSWIAQQSGLREWVGHRIEENAEVNDYTLINKDWEKTISLQRNKILDDTYGVFGPVVDDLGQQSRLWPDDVMTAVLEAGTTQVCFDGQYFFDTDHPVDMNDASKGTYVNNLVGAQYDLSVDPIAAYKLARAHGMKFVGEGGRPLGIIFDTLMVPPDLEEPALRVANALLTAQAIKNIAGSENVAAASVTNVYQGAVTVIVNPRLTNQSAAYLMSTKRALKPFIWQLRQAPNLIARNSPDDPAVFDSKKFLYGVDARGNGGYSFPFLAVRLTPS